MRTTLITTIALTALLAAGCGPKGAATDNSTTTGGSNPTSENATPVVPDALKHEGFAYYGLGRDKILQYDFENLEGTGPQPGTLRADIKSADGEKATYAIERSGSLIALGSETDEVRPDGIYMTEMSLGTLKSPVLSMPADPAVGKSWPSKMEVEIPGAGVTTMEVLNKVEKIEKVTTPAGEFDALLVVSTGDMIQGDKKGKISSKVWYAKDVGIVQLRLESVDAEGKSIKQSMVLTGMQDKEK